MSAMNESYTAVVARNVDWAGDWTTEPYETAWAREAIFFVSVLRFRGEGTTCSARVQISPDGMHWVDEGTRMEIPVREAVTAVKVSHFGGWLRLAGSAPDGSALTVITYLVLKA